MAKKLLDLSCIWGAILPRETSCCQNQVLWKNKGNLYRGAYSYRAIQRITEGAKKEARKFYFLKVFQFQIIWVHYCLLCISWCMHQSVCITGKYCDHQCSKGSLYLLWCQLNRNCQQGSRIHKALNNPHLSSAIIWLSINNLWPPHEKHPYSFLPKSFRDIKNQCPEK